MDFKIFCINFANVIRQITLKRLLFFLLAGMILASCEFKLKSYDDDDDNARIEVKRYDRLESRYLTTGDFSALQQMNIDYPMETRTLIEKMTRIGSVDDPSISTKFLNFYQDSVLQTLIADASAEFASMDDVNEEFNSAFKYLRKHIAHFPKPMIYAQIGALDQSVVVGDQTIGFSIDKYLGVNYPLYAKYYTYAQRQQMTREYIVPDCLNFYLLSLYPMKNFEQRTQRERDLRVAKVMWVTNKALDKRFWKTPFVKMIDNYVKCHDDVTIDELLKGNDYSMFK